RELRGLSGESSGECDEGDAHSFNFTTDGGVTTEYLSAGSLFSGSRCILDPFRRLVFPLAEVFSHCSQSWLRRLLARRRRIGRPGRMAASPILMACGRR